MNEAGAQAAIDGNKGTSWKVSGGWPQEIVLELPENHHVTAIKYIHGNRTANYLTQYSIYASPDGQSWVNTSAPGTLKNTALEWEVRLSWPKDARYIKLIYLGSGGGDSALTGEIQVVSDTVTPPPSSPPPMPKPSPTPPPPPPAAPAPPPTPQTPQQQVWCLMQNSQAQQALSSRARRVCNDGIDNNGDGLRDLEGSWCIQQYQLAGYEGVQATAQQCAVANSRPLKPTEQAAFCEATSCRAAPDSTPPSPSPASPAPAPASCRASAAPLPSSTGSTHHVSPTGSDSYSCEQAKNSATPKRTINAALKCLKPGDTLLLGDGVYQEVIRNLPSGTSWANRITIKAQNPRRAIIRSPANCLVGGNYSIINFNGGESYIEINGLVLDGNNTCRALLVFRSPGGAETGKDYHHIRIINNEFKNAAGSAAGSGMISGGHLKTNRAYQIEILNNHIHHMGGGPDPRRASFNHCMYFKADDSVIQGNHIHDCAGSGITLHQSLAGGRSANNITLRNNRIHDMVRGPCIRLAGDEHTAYNNVCSNAGTTNVAPLHIALSSPNNSKFYNNTVYNSKSSKACIWISSSSNPATNSQVKNNLCWGGVNDRIMNTGTNTVSSHNFCKGPGCLGYADPRFVNPAAGDFRLRPDSPAIDKGTPLSGVKNDFNCVPRSQGAAPDIGAFEYR